MLKKVSFTREETDLFTFGVASRSPQFTRTPFNLCLFWPRLIIDGPGLGPTLKLIRIIKLLGALVSDCLPFNYYSTNSFLFFWDRAWAPSPQTMISRSPRRGNMRRKGAAVVLWSFSTFMHA